MKKRKVVKLNTHAGTGRTCVECCRGEWNMNNLNYKGKPFMIYCEHGNRGYSHVEKSNVTYEDLAACEHFVQGKRGDGNEKKL